MIARSESTILIVDTLIYIEICRHENNLMMAINKIDGLTESDLVHGLILELIVT